MKYIIHRGITSPDSKENAYQSIKKALRDNTSSGVEFDIRLTKDKKIVLSHDSLIHLNCIEKMNYVDIIKEKYLTTLDKILTIDTNKMLLIDIKTNNNYKVFAGVLLNYLQDTKRNIYLCSFNKKIIKYLRKKTNYKLGHIQFSYRKNSLDFVMVNFRGITDKKILQIDHKDVFLWTIKDEKEMTSIKEKFTSLNDYYIIIDKKNAYSLTST